jgi:hypothetical protein
MRRKRKSTEAPKAGRPLLGNERRERYQVRLEPSLAEWLDQLGDSNRSAGIERAAKAAGYKS